MQIWPTQNRAVIVMTCATCAYREQQSIDRPAACMHPSGPMRGWYVEPEMVHPCWAASRAPTTKQ